MVTGSSLSCTCSVAPSAASRCTPPSGLFSGDIVYDDRLLDDTHGGDQKDYVATIARLRDLPVTVVHPGHGSSFDRTRLCEIADACTTARP
ncbi:hypothetical protein [Streptomyces atratus]|uniref:hypothetical protein n=1 Tax=Streptomyces atratus TaxID=1893 RepID=UPI0022519B05|nr:hypothetical protein [Streptomyces atratus]MCX5345351.1 hypothetical protein [Streptomyces atratus]